MFFTQDDYKKIQQWLIKNSVKDTEFNEANIPFNGNEIVSIVQGNQNKKVFLKDLVSQIFNLGVSDFVNITDKYDAPNISLEEAIRCIPSKARKVGQVITFVNEEGHWHIYQFRGVLNQWNTLDKWEDLFDWEKLISNPILPDEEDLTKSLPDKDGNSYLSLKDRAYNPEDFSGLGRIILRKNIVEIEDPIYGKDKKNILYQGMINKENTIYEIRYDFDLNGEEITIPEGCVLDFQGGSLSNGTIVGNRTIIIASISKIFDLTTDLRGTWNVSEAYPEWFGAQADGLTDDTLLIQKTLDVFDKIYFPALSYAITQIFIKSNTKIEFSSNCHVKAARALIDTIQTEPRVLGESMICLHEANNVTIIGNHSVIDMRREDFPSEELGESRHCFRIKDSKNVYIENICGNNSFGDGFCLAFPDGTHNNKNITLKGCIADNNRRQGLSIIDGEDVFIEDCIFSNTHGTAPSAGIDIEPNAYEGYKINNINITNCRSKNNAGAGLLIAGSLKVDNYNKNVNINVNGYTSENDEVGISLQNYSLHDCLGQISFNKINVSGKYFLTVGAWGGNPNLTTIFRDCTFVKSAIIDSEVPAYNNIISFELRSGSYNTYIGDIIIDGLYIGCTVNEKPLCVVNYYANYSSDNDKTLKNVQIKNINVSSNAQVINDYGPVRHSAKFSKYINVSIEFIVPYTLTGLSKYCQPYANNYFLDYGNYVLGNHSPLLNHIVRFIYNGSAVAKTFVVDDSTIIFDEEFKQLSSLSITDPESSYLGGRKAATGEWIEFIAREDGWHIYNMSPLMSKFISKTLK